ncbi:hypothetical protein CRENBAI_000145 [Crenichthys baileyi]|uniref:Uncharacterized protein n=1 Tax=Crenichthys baileyi TaxID=28760 RepID=A0AAV9R0J1_9TELE
MSFCCVSGCNNRYTPGTSIRFYRIPGGSRQFQVNRRRLWIEAIQRANGSSSEIGADVRICGAHFVTGEASTDPDRPNFVPTLFTCTKQRQNPSKKAEWASGHQKRRQQKPYGKTKTTTATREDEETENTQALRKDAETENARTLRKDAETENARTLRKDAETENARTLRKDAETENARTLRKDAETENARTLRKDAETENARTLRKDAETENARTLRKDAETENGPENARTPEKGRRDRKRTDFGERTPENRKNARTLRKDAETENARTLRKDAETENARTLRKDAETENARTLRKDAETENARTLRKDAETENARTLRKDAETENARTLRKDAETENAQTLGGDEETRKLPTQPASESPSDHQAHPLMETGDELLTEIQTLLCTSVSKEEETEDKKIYDKDQGLTKSETGLIVSGLENKSSLNITPSQQKPPGGMLKPDKMNPVVLLKPLVLPQGAYQVDLRNEAFTAVSPKEWREETDMSQSGLTEPYLNTRDQPSFPCNLCDRTFTTSHYLKRHKLLHVRDVRKCLRCGALFCRRHNHVLFQTRAEPLPESEESSSGSEDELLDNNVSKEKDETSKITKMVDHTLSTQTGTPPDSPALTSSPLLKTFPLTDIRKPLLVSVKPAAVPSPPSPIFRLPNNQGTLFQFKPLLSDSSPALSQPHLSQQPQLPSSLKIFSAQHLTSALLDVQRNYEYILSKPKKDVKIKEEPEELVQICPDEPPVKQVKLEKIAYDLEMVI